MADVGEIPILLIKVQSVADYKDIGDLKAHIIRFHGKDAPRVLV